MIRLTRRGRIALVLVLCVGALLIGALTSMFTWA